MCDGCFETSGSDLNLVYNSPSLYVRMPLRNKSWPWDPDYYSWPYQRSAYDFWEYDTRRQVGAPRVYNNNRHVPGEMESGDYIDINTNQARPWGEAEYEFYHQADETMGDPYIHRRSENIIDPFGEGRYMLRHNQESILSGQTQSGSGQILSGQTLSTDHTSGLDDHSHDTLEHSDSHVHKTGGGGGQYGGIPADSCDYCGGWQIGALYSPEVTQAKCCPSYDQIIGCTNCTSFMTDENCCCLTYNNPVAIGPYAQESFSQEEEKSSDLSHTGTILAIIGIIVILFIIVKLFFF